MPSHLPVASTLKGQRAVVLGGGIGGLAAAAVLSRHFAEVTVLERDTYADGPPVRPHVPHGAHVHLLLAGGLVTLSRLFPHLPGWLDAAGFPEGDLTHHTRVAFDGRWLPRSRSGIPIRTCTRPDVEQLLLRNARQCPNVRILTGRAAEGLLGKDRVEGVYVVHAGEREDHPADLVVDTMGRSSPAVKWLRDAGRATVDEVSVDAGVVYSSAWFDPPGPLADDWTVLATLPAIPSAPAMGVIVRLGDRMLCSAISYGKPKGAREPGDIVDAMRGLAVPQLHDLLRASTPASGVSVYANTINRRRRFSGMPDGLVVLGDAACSLNPRYGQGMTVASLSVERLAASLDEHFARAKELSGFPDRFQRSLDRVLEVPWQVALLEDRSWVTHFTGAKPSFLERLVLAGTQRVLGTANTDLDTYIRFMRVAHLLDSPTAMLAPRTLGSILRGGGTPGTEDPPSIEVERRAAS